MSLILWLTRRVRSFRVRTPVAPPQCLEADFIQADLLACEPDAGQTRVGGCQRHGAQGADKGACDN